MFVKVRVKTGAKKDSLVLLGDKQFSVSTKALAERNEANQSVRSLLAGWYNIEVGKIRLINGHHQPRKLFEVLVEENNTNTHD